MNILELFEMLGVESDADPWLYIEGLIHNSTLEEPIKCEMEAYITHKDSASAEVLELMLKMLLQSQKHPVRDGLNYSQKQLNKYLDEKI